MSSRHKALIISRYDFYVFNDALKNMAEEQNSNPHVCM